MSKAIGGIDKYINNKTKKLDKTAGKWFTGKSTPLSQITNPKYNEEEKKTIIQDPVAEQPNEIQSAPVVNKIQPPAAVTVNQINNEQANIASIVNTTTEQSEFSLKNLTIIQNMVYSLLEHGNIGRSQKEAVDSLTFDDIPAADHCMFEALKNQIYDESIKKSLISYYNIILKLTNAKELPKHVNEMLDNQPFGTDAQKFFVDLLKADDNYGRKLEEGDANNNFPIVVETSKKEDGAKTELESKKLAEPLSQDTNNSNANHQERQECELVLNEALAAGNIELVNECFYTMEALGQEQAD